MDIRWHRTDGQSKKTINDRMSFIAMTQQYAQSLRMDLGSMMAC